MPVYSATAISGSIFYGKVKLFKPRQLSSFPKKIDQTQIDSELNKLKTGIEKLESEITASMNNPDTSPLDKDILNTHLMIVTDIEITQIMENSIRQDLLSAPQAVFASFEMVSKNFEQMDNNYFAQRADDYKDVAQRLLTAILDEKDQVEIEFNPDDIVFLHEITPSLVSRFAKAGLKAYCTERGSYTSHSSILARAMGFTALVAREEFMSQLTNGDTAILDAHEGKIVINPSSEQINDYKQKLHEHKVREEFLKTEASKPAITQNGINIQVKANIEYPGEMHKVLENQCQGIGLFRTEFIYLNRTSLPDEEEQTRVYTHLVSKLPDYQVIIRTFDLGGDKLSYLQQFKLEENPNLGCRGIRFSLQQRELFKAQIRSILKASAHGKAAIMFPMIMSTDDFKTAKELVTECMTELDNESTTFDRNIPVGAMIETPSAAICAEQLAQVCDFFSLGTNDLVQYTLAVDRNNDKVASYYIQHHPAVLLLIKQTISAAKKAGIPVSICGEMASELMYVPLLVGLGIDELSITPDKTAEVKAVIRNCDAGLFELIQDFDFNTDIAAIEHLIRHTLKPYYTIQS